MKKIMALLLVCIMTLSLCACTKNNENDVTLNSDTANQNSEETKSLSTNNTFDLKVNSHVKIPKRTITSVDAEHCLWNEEMHAKYMKPSEIFRTYNINIGKKNYYVSVKSAVLMDDHEHWKEEEISFPVSVSNNTLILHESDEFDDDNTIYANFYNGKAEGQEEQLSIGIQANYKYYDTVYLDKADIEYDKPIPIIVRGFSNTKDAKDLTIDDYNNLDEFLAKKYDKMEVLYIVFQTPKGHEAAEQAHLNEQSENVNSSLHGDSSLGFEPINNTSGKDNKHLKLHHTCKTPVETIKLTKYGLENNEWKEIDSYMINGENINDIYIDFREDKKENKLSCTILCGNEKDGFTIEQNDKYKDYEYACENNFVTLDENNSVAFAMVGYRNNEIPSYLRMELCQTPDAISAMGYDYAEMYTISLIN